MAKEITVTDHLRDIPAAVRPTVRAARRLVRAVAPKAEEIAYQSKAPRSRSAMWKLARYSVGDEDVAGIGTFSTHASLWFYRGRELDDPEALLQGSGKSRGVRLASAADVERPAVRRLVRQAFQLAR